MFDLWVPGVICSDPPPLTLLAWEWQGIEEQLFLRDSGPRRQGWDLRPQTPTPFPDSRVEEEGTFVSSFTSRAYKDPQKTFQLG